MATQGEKIDELFRLAHTVTERVDTLREEVKGGRAESGKMAETLGLISTKLALLEQGLVDLRQWKDGSGLHDLKSEVTSLKEKVQKLQEAKDKAGNRAWTIVPNVVGAIVNVLLGAAIAYYVSQKK